jgi:hypothetical protein
MEPIVNMKREFLAIYHYDTGGVWFVFEARSEKEILERFPFLQVVASRPAWLTDEDFAQIKKASFQDIDEPTIPTLRDMELR